MKETCLSSEEAGVPIGAYCQIAYNKESPFTAYVSFSTYHEDAQTDGFGIDDDHVFFYVDSEEELNQLMINGTKDFSILSYELAFLGFNQEHGETLSL